jgi:hypothetical protein
MRRYDRAGRKTCGDPDAIFIALLLMPYVPLAILLTILIIDCLRGRP